MSALGAMADEDAVALEEAFCVSREAYRVLEASMTSPRARAMRHEELEEHLAEAGREFLRVMFQSHLRLRALTEPRAAQVADREGIGRNWIERGRSRELATLFGPVTVARIAYRGQYVPNLYVQDAVLNLPAGRHSHGVKKLAAACAARGSFQDAAEQVRAVTGAPIGKRQVEELAADAARDIEAFYELARAVVQAVEAVREAKSELRCDRAEKEGPQALASPTVDLRVKGSSSQREGPRKRA